MCPASEHIPKKCRSCCCVSSKNVEFYEPNHTPSCEATGVATYKVSLKPRISRRYCQPNLMENNPYFSGLVVGAHTKYVRDHDKCLNTEFADDLFPFLNNFRNVTFTRRILERQIREGLISSFFQDSNLMSRHPRRKGRRSGFISITSNVSAVSVFSKMVRLCTSTYICNILYIYIYIPSILLPMQLPVGNKFIGISAINLCGRSEWKKKVEVCVELLEVVNKTASPDAKSAIQGNQCSFGSIVFVLKTIGSQLVQHRPKPPPTCKPANGIYL